MPTITDDAVKKLTDLLNEAKRCKENWIPIWVPDVIDALKQALEGIGEEQ